GREVACATWAARRESRRDLLPAPPTAGARSTAAVLILQSAPVRRGALHCMREREATRQITGTHGERARLAGAGASVLACGGGPALEHGLHVGGLGAGGAVGGAEAGAFEGGDVGPEGAALVGIERVGCAVAGEALQGGDGAEGGDAVGQREGVVWSRGDHAPAHEEPGA